MKVQLFCAMIIVCTSSCESDHTEIPLDPAKDHLIFGTYYGMCVGEQCVEIFALQDQKLYEDRGDQYPGMQSDPRDFQLLGADQYELTKELYASIPDALLQTESTVFGCPDCSDGGGIYLEIKTERFNKVFYIDNFKHNIPDYLHPLVDDIHERVAHLQ